MNNFTFRPALKCTVCGSLFQKVRHTTGKYCGRVCAWKARGGSDFNAKIAKESASKRGDAQRGCGTKGYVKRDGKHEHRIVAEHILGRPLDRKEIVHHIDGNKRNNDPSNLKIMTQRQHMIEHGIGLPGVTPKHKPWEFRSKTK